MIRSSIRVSTIFTLFIFSLTIIVSVFLFAVFGHQVVYAQSADIVEQGVDDALSVDAVNGPYDGIEGLKLSVSPGDIISDGGTVAIVAWVSQGSDIDWTWDFGDGQTYFSSGTGRFNDITHTYNLANPAIDQIYTISVEAKNAKNRMVASVKILVKIKAPTGLSVSYSPSEPSVGQEVLFNATLENPAGVIYTWVFGDGSSEETTSPTIKHVYTDSRPYNYSVTASNSSGRSPTIGGTIDVSDAGLTFCNIGVEGSSEVDNQLTILAQSDGSNVRYTWKFSDEATERSNQSIKRSYTQEGRYTIDLTCYNNKNSIRSATRTLNIIDTPITRLRIMNTASVNTPQKPKESVLFSAHSDGTSISYKWDFGDGNSMTTLDSTITHSYLAEGRYIITVIASNSAGSKMIKAPVHIVTAEPIAAQNVELSYQLFPNPDANPGIKFYPVAGDEVLLTIKTPTTGPTSGDVILNHGNTSIKWSVSGITRTVEAASIHGKLAIPEAGQTSMVVIYKEPGRYVERVTVYHIVDGVKFVYGTDDIIVQIGSEQRMPFIVR